MSAESSVSTHRRSRVQLNGPHMPRGNTRVLVRASPENNSSLGDMAIDVATPHVGSHLHENNGHGLEQPQASQELPEAAARQIVFEPGLPMLRHVRHELEGLTRSELATISEVLDDLLYPLADKKTSEHGDGNVSSEPIALKDIKDLPDEMRNEAKDSRNEVNEFASNVVELKRDFDHFKIAVDSALTSLKHKVNSLEVELNSFKASQTSIRKQLTDPRFCTKIASRIVGVHAQEQQ